MPIFCEQRHPSIVTKCSTLTETTDDVHFRVTSRLVNASPTDIFNFKGTVCHVKKAFPNGEVQLRTDALLATEIWLA